MENDLVSDDFVPNSRRQNNTCAAIGASEPKTGGTQGGASQRIRPPRALKTQRAPRNNNRSDRPLALYQQVGVAQRPTTISSQIVCVGARC